MSTPDLTERPVLVVEDDHTLRLALLERLGDEHPVLTAATAEEGRVALRRQRPALALVDLGLPDGDGMDVVASARAVGVPVIVLTASSGEAVRIRAFEAGADDFVSKPFSPAELAHRVRAVLRRTAGTAAPSDDLWLDEPGRRCGRGAQEIELTRTEFDLLAVLVRHRGQTLTKAQLLDQVWGYGGHPENLVEVHVSALRRKLEQDGTRLITTVRGIGYRLD